MEYILIIELCILIAAVLIRSVILWKNGINAIVFGVTDKTDYILIPVVLSFFYALIAPIFNFPFPVILKNSFWNIDVLNWFAIVICTISLVWFIFTLKIFGDSFRVGIDEKTKDKLIVKGTFAFSRNPIYMGIIVFFFGFFLQYPTIVTGVFLIFMIIMTNRQILQEEKFLKSHYGEEYEEYSANVRRYI